MGSIVGVLETQVRASTQDFDRGMQRAEQTATRFGTRVSSIGTRAASAFGQAMTAVAASTAAAEKNWVTLGATILGAFATGGPIAGGIAAAAAGVGLLIGKTKEAKKEADEYAKAWDEVAKKAASAHESILQAIDKATIAAGAPDLTETEIRIAKLGVQIEQAQDAFHGAMNAEIRDKALDALIKLEDEMRGLQRLAELEADARERSAAATRKQAQDAAYFRELERQDEARRKAAIDADPRVRWLRSGRAPAEDFPLFGSSSMFTVGDGMKEFKGTVESPKIRVFDPAEELRREQERLQMVAQQVAEPFHSAFAEAVVDGFRTGFKNLRDIGQNLLFDWLGMASRALSQRLFQPIFNSLFGASPGGSVLQVLPVAVPAATFATGIQASGPLESIIHVTGSDVRTLEEYRAGQ